MRIFCGLVLIFGLIIAVTPGMAEAAEKYPTRAIEMVVPFNPGGAADLGARSYSEILARILKVPITVVNRAGGTGIQGTTYVVKGKKDGYTLLASTDTPLMVMPAISKEVSYDPLKDVVPLGYFGYAPGIFAVRADSPIKTLAQLIDYARKNPGKLKNASAGAGAESFFNLQLLCAKEKLKIVSVPFKSGGEAVVALLGGHTDMSSNTAASLGPHLKAGTLRGLAISSKKRHPDFPNIPTTAELGHPDLNFEVWIALFAPKGVPQQVIDTLVPAVEKAFTDPQARQQAMNAGLVVDYMGPQETAKLLETGLAAVKKIAHDAELAK
jgi:tripartite-type tricarboxylate transporter receptor subunit TctC